jgi:hypothetical protein
MRRLLAIAIVLLLGGCVTDARQPTAAGSAAGSAAAGGPEGVALWTPKPGLAATVIVLAPEKFYKLANTVRPDLANRPVSGLAFFSKKKCIVWVRSDLRPTDFRLTLAHELRHCQTGRWHKD